MPQYQGIWTLAQAAQLQSTQRWATDPLFENTTLLLQADNAANGAQNNTFLDSSSNNFTITRNGNTTQGTFTPFSQSPGWWSNYFDGTGDYLATPANAAFNVGTASFTLEAWVFPTSFASARALFSFADTNVFYFNTSGLPVYGIFGVSDTTIGSTTVSLNAWTHVAFVRSGSTLTCYLNGISAGSISTSSSIGNSTSGNSIGQHRTSNYFLGYISNLRLANGSAIYTSNFIPSAIPLTITSQGASSTDVKLLTCQSNRFIDNSTANSGSGFALTSFADVSVQAFSPFAPQYQYTPSVTGGSGYFDGSGDYLTAPDNAALDLGAGDFCVEAFVYPTGDVAYSAIAGKNTGAGDGWFLEYSATRGLIAIWETSNSVSSAAAYTKNSWQHIVFCRSGSTVSLYKDGIRLATTTSTATIAYAGVCTIGVAAGGGVFPGYITNARIVKGSSPYNAASSTLTVPTAPLTAIANTSLLLNFTNAAITDGTLKNNLETFGNAQVNTSVVKYGSGSMYFDGSLDWLTTPFISHPAYLFQSTADWTLEFWFNTGVTSGTMGLVDTYYTNSAPYSGLVVQIINGTINVYDGGSNRATTTTYANNTWQHFAWVNSNGTSRVYMNGVNVVIGGVTSWATSSNIYRANAPIQVGRDYQPAYFNGYIDDLRITRFARYTANFIPPSVALPRQ